MQLSPVKNTLEIGEVLATGEFGIAKNAKMFKILSDSMYKDKIGSLVRELCSNARDAHVSNGTPDLQFEVHLPNAFEPWFSVIDFGTGISPVDMYEVFCIYGESTKDQSNDEVGAFGLGAKTPFAYSDNFTVRSRYQGVERMYTASYGVDGMPMLPLQMEVDTTEPDGLMIMVPVDEMDFSRFQSKTKSQLKYFPVKPIVMNCNGFEWINTEENITYTSDLCTMYSGVYGDPIDGLWLTQGGVAYPVDINELSGISTDVQAFAAALSSNNTVMQFPIGQIDVTAPRESVSYDKKTIANIIFRISQISSVMCRDALVGIQKEGSVWNRAVLFNSHITVIKKAITSSPLFDALFDGMTAVKHGSTLAVNVDDLVAEKLLAVKMAKYDTYRTTRTTVRRHTVGNYSKSTDEYLTPNAEVHVFLRDTKSKPMARIKHFVFENNFPLTLMIESANGDLVDGSSRDAVAKALRMPVENVKLLSELEAPKVVSGSRSGYTVPKAYQWSNGQVNSCSRDWSRLFDDINDIGVAIWVEMDRHDIQWNDDTSIVFGSDGTLGLDIISVNGKTAERIRAGKIGNDLISVEDAASRLRDMMNKQKSMFVKYARDSAFLDAALGDAAINTLVAHDMFPKLSKQIDNMRDKRRSMGDTIANNSWMRHYLYEYTAESAEKGKLRGEAIVNDITVQYPMLKYVDKFTGRITGQLTGDALTDVLAYVAEINKAAVDTAA